MRHTEADHIEAAANALGFEVEKRFAGTGTVYLQLDNGSDYITVRVADHAEVYEPQNRERKISVSPDELSVDQAIELLRDPAQIKPYRRDPKVEAERREYFARVDAAKAAAKRKFSARVEDAAKIVTPELLARWSRMGRSKDNARKLAKELRVKWTPLYAAMRAALGLK